MSESLERCVLSWSDFCQKITDLLNVYRGVDVNCVGDQISVRIEDCIDISYSSEEYSKLMQQAQQYEYSQFSIYNKNSLESIVVEQGSRFFYSAFTDESKEQYAKKDTNNHISYCIRKISDELLLNIISEIDMKAVRLSRMSTGMLKARINNRRNNIDLFDLIIFAFRIPLTVAVVETEDTRNVDVLRTYTNSYLLTIAFNDETLYKTATVLGDFYNSRQLRFRRTRDELDIMPPQLIYKEKLIEQYYMALSSGDPFVEFIGFYHIMEYYFYEIYNEEINKKVQQMIQSPKFSSNDLDDIAKIVNSIKRISRANAEAFQGSEYDALVLTLNRFIDISELATELSEIDDSLLEYYKNNDVSFSKGGKVDLVTENKDTFMKLASRIYRTRNALVHSKYDVSHEDNQMVYSPFNDSLTLTKEIPLMRLIAESIIIKSASPIR